MKYLQLQYFVTVCKYNNITRAAEELLVSQPAISSSIRELETQLGVKLFDRINNKLIVTPEGKMFHDQAIKIIQSTERLEMLMKDIGHQHHRIAIGVPPMIGVFMFINIFNRFKALHPEVSIELVESGSLDIRKHVLENKVDLAIGVLDDKISHRIETVKLIDTSLVLAVAKTHDLAKREAVSFEMLKKESLILMKADSFQNQKIRIEFEKLGVQPNVLLYSSQFHTIRQFLLSGNCAAFVFKEIADMDENLVAVPLETPIPIQIGLMWKRSNLLYTDTEKFMSFIKREYQCNEAP